MAASHRWLEKYSAEYQPLGTVILGDDLYSKQPFCQKVLDKWVAPVKTSGELDIEPQRAQRSGYVELNITGLMCSWTLCGVLTSSSRFEHKNW